MPPGVVTVTVTVPVASAGAVAVIEVEELTVRLLGGVDPNSTVDVAVNPVPVMATEAPPVRGPAEGLTPLTVGTAR